MDVHPTAFVVVTVYVVVNKGLAVGFATVEELSPVVGLQEYVFPATAGKPMVAPVVFWMQFFILSPPALETGGELFTVTVT